jgi:hypothetical protein
MKTRLAIALCIMVVLSFSVWLILLADPPPPCIYSGEQCFLPSSCGPLFSEFCFEEWYCPEYSIESCGCCDPLW